MDHQPHSDRAHATLAPSSAHRWVNCPGSIALARGIEESPSVFAAEGTAAHQLAEHCLSAGFDASRFHGWVVETRPKPGTAAIHQGKADGVTSFEVDAGMVDAVQTYLDVVREIAEESDDFEIEQRMDITALVPGVFGTGDAIAYRSDLRRVTIVDYKHGQGVPVDVVENEQLLTYAAGVAQRYHNRGVDEVELIIVQPRAPHRDGPVRRWVTDALTLFEHVVALQVAADRIDNGDQTLNPGDWCKFCKAAPVCPAMADKVFNIIGANIVDGEFFGMDDPATYDSDRLASALRAAPFVKNWLNSVEQFGHAEALRGRMPTGFKLVDKRAIRKWKDDDVAVEALQMLGVSDDDLFETKLRSPAQVEKTIPKKSRDIVKDLAESKSSGTVLAPVDDPRPAVDPNDSRGFEAVEIAE